MGEINACNFLVGNLKGRENSEDLGVGRKIIVKIYLRKIGWEIVE
jgi:hypothetical protein